MEEIREKYREKLLKTCKSIDHCLKVAKTCYTVTYQSQKEQQSNTEPVHKKQSALSFAWLFDDYLNLAKNIRKAEKIDFLRFAQLVDRGFAITVTRVPMKRSEPEPKDGTENEAIEGNESSPQEDPPASQTSVASSISPLQKNKWGDTCHICGVSGHWKNQCPRRTPPRKK